jgi:hypothetical protein
MLFQSFHERCHGLGVVGGQAGEGFLVRRLLGVVALGEQIGDLVRGQAGALQRRTDLALSLRAMASGALGFVSGAAVFGKRGQSERCGQRNDEQHDERFGESHEFSFGFWNVWGPKVETNCTPPAPPESMDQTLW